VAVMVPLYHAILSRRGKYGRRCQKTCRRADGQRLACGYYSFLVAHLVAVNPESINSLPPAKILGEDPTGEIKRKDGSFHTLNLLCHLDLLRGTPLDETPRRRGPARNQRESRARRSLLLLCAVAL